VKASAGGGGRGMRVVNGPAELPALLVQAQQEAGAAFSCPDVYIEKYIRGPRHIEFQVLADQHGNVEILGERECSIQRRHQKLLEESPSPALKPEVRCRVAEKLREAIRAVGYTNAGTVEFLMDDTGSLYFIEVNARIQVEHPVTEMVTGVDLVKSQILIAAGERLPDILGGPVKPQGHAIECRINAENPVSFRPSPGKILYFHTPGGLGVRVDSAVYHGYSIPPYYDSLVGKLIVHGRTRGECLMRLKRALDEFVVDGIETTLPLFRALVREKEIIDGEYHIHWLEEFLAKGGMRE